MEANGIKTRVETVNEQIKKGKSEMQVNIPVETAYFPTNGTYQLLTFRFYKLPKGAATWKAARFPYEKHSITDSTRIESAVAGFQLVAVCCSVDLTRERETCSADYISRPDVKFGDQFEN